MRTLLKAAIGAAVAFVVQAAPAAAQFLTFVSATGNDANNCFVQAAPCKTLQRAINQTSAGGELRLLSSLQSNGFINKSMTIEGGYNTVIGSIAVNNASAIVRFKRLNLNGVHAFPTGFNLINAAAVHIEECSAERYTQDGIFTQAGASMELVVSHSVSRDNDSDGIAIVGSNNTVKLAAADNVFANNGENGLLMEGGEAAVVRSAFFGSGAHGVFLDGASVNVDGAVAAANFLEGFNISAGELTLISCDAAANNRGLLINLPDSPIARLSACVITGNASNGVINFGSLGNFLSLGNNLIAGNNPDVNEPPGLITPE